MVGDFVCRDDAGSVSGDFFLFLLRCNRSFKSDRAIYGDDLDVVRVSGEVLVVNDGLPDVRRGEAIRLGVGLVVRG